MNAIEKIEELISEVNGLLENKSLESIRKVNKTIKEIDKIITEELSEDNITYSQLLEIEDKVFDMLRKVRELLKNAREDIKAC
jgi:hypothetical protein